MRKLLTFICCMLVAGCALVKATYYKPLVDGYYKGACGGPDNYGAKKLNEKLAYFVYVVSDCKESTSAIKIGFNFRVHPGSVLTLTSGTVIVNGSNYHQELPICTIQKQEWKADEKQLVKTEFKYSAPLIGYPESRLQTSKFGLSEILKWGGYSFEFTIPPYSGNELFITLPGLIIDGQYVTPDVLKVIKTTEYYWQFNC